MMINHDIGDVQDGGIALSLCLSVTVFHFFFTGLTSLPATGPSSLLKVLNAWGCDIESLPHDSFHHGLEMVRLGWNRSESTY